MKRMPPTDQCPSLRGHGFHLQTRCRQWSETLTGPHVLGHLGYGVTAIHHVTMTRLTEDPYRQPKSHSGKLKEAEDRAGERP